MIKVSHQKEKKNKLRFLSCTKIGQLAGFRNNSIVLVLVCSPLTFA